MQSWFVLYGPLLPCSVSLRLGSTRDSHPAPKGLRASTRMEFTATSCHPNQAFGLIVSTSTNSILFLQYPHLKSCPCPWDFHFLAVWSFNLLRPISSSCMKSHTFSLSLSFNITLVPPSESHDFLTFSLLLILSFSSSHWSGTPLPASVSFLLVG